MSNNNLKASVVDTSKATRVQASATRYNTSVEASSNQAQYYSNLSKAYAFGEGIINHEDYSSKTYALQSKDSANEAKSALEEAKGYTTNAVEQIQNAENLALSNINILEDSVSSSISQGIQTIGETSSQALTDLQTASNGIISEIEELNTDVIDEINDLADTVLEEIADAGGGDNLKYSNITNCLLEVPQRITLSTDGSLYTINSSSTFIFPYGTEIVGNSSDEPEIVGTLTVDAEGGYSGFSYPNSVGSDSTPKNYILAPTFDKADYSKVEYLFKFKMGEEGGGLISTIDHSESTYLSVSTDGVSFMDGDCSFFHSSENTVFTPGNTYWVKVLAQNGQRVRVSISSDGVTYTDLTDDWDDPEMDYSENCLTGFSDGIDKIIGVYVSMGSMNFAFDGTLYVKESYIKIDDEPFLSFEPPVIRNLAEECPIGSVFNDVFIVVDTQQADGKCFVWAKPLADIRINPPRMETGLGIITNAGNCLTGNPELFRSSDTKPAETTIQFWYDTKANMVKRLSNTGDIVAEGYSLPIFAFDTSFTNYITQVFNGFGYMDSTLWRDKDIKSLAPNGWNKDGTYNSIERISNDINVFTVPTTETNECYIGLKQDGTLSYYYQNSWTYNDKLNSLDVVGSPRYGITFAGTFTATNGVISNFNPKRPIRVADIQDVVKKSGDTMTGTLTLQNVLNIKRSNTLDYTDTNHTTVSETAGEIYFRDKNDEVVGYVQTYFNQYNNMVLSTSTRRSIDGTLKTAQTQLYVDVNGNANFNFPKCTTKATTASSATSDRVAVVVQNYVSGTSWYRVWSDGWVEQGGAVTIAKDANATITFTKAFTTAAYTVEVTVRAKDVEDSCGCRCFVHKTLKTTGFTIGNRTVVNSSTGIYAQWYACGY